MEIKSPGGTAEESQCDGLQDSIGPCNLSEPEPPPQLATLRRKSITAGLIGCAGIKRLRFNRPYGTKRFSTTETQQ